MELNGLFMSAGASGSTLSPRFGRLLDMDVDSDSDECRARHLLAVRFQAKLHV